MIASMQLEFSMQQVHGNFETEYEKRYEIDWESDLAESQESAGRGDSWDDIK
jgi:hypothetical protein